MVSKLPRNDDHDNSPQAQLESFFSRYLDIEQVSSKKDSKTAETSSTEPFETRSGIVDFKIFPTKSNPKHCHALVTLRYRNPSTQRNILRDAPSKLCMMFGRTEVRVGLISEKGVSAELERQRKSSEASKQNKKRTRKPSAKREAYKTVAKEFHGSLFLKTGASNNGDGSVTTMTVCRSELGSVFDTWLGQWNKENPEIPVVTGGRTQASVMSILRSMGLLKSKRKSHDVVVCTLLASRKRNSTISSDRPLSRQQATHAVEPEQSSAAHGIVVVAPGKVSVAKTHRQQTEEDKFDVSIIASSALSPTGAGDTTPMVAPGKVHDTILSVRSSNARNSIWLEKIVIRGRDKKSYKLSPPVGPKEQEKLLAPNKDYKYKITFRPSKTGIFKASVWFYFQVTNGNDETPSGAAGSNERKSFEIAKFFNLRSGDANLANILKPKSKYMKKQRKRVTRFSEEDVPHLKMGEGRARRCFTAC